MEPLLVFGGFILLAIIFRLIAGGPETEQDKTNAVYTVNRAALISDVEKYILGDSNACMVN